jgi:hypothetical protein
MNKALKWFTIKLVIIGGAENNASGLVYDLREEIEARSYLRNPEIYWNGDENRVIVQVDDQGLDMQSTADRMAEELLEITSAVIREFEHIRIEVLNISDASEFFGHEVGTA